MALMKQAICRWGRVVMLSWGLLSLAGCASTPAGYDDSAFRAASPRSVLVLPPLNATPDVLATPSVWSQLTMPLAEAGYYVLPVALVDETLRNHGVQSAEDAQQIPLDKLRATFGADAGLYVQINRYGAVYKVLSSETAVTLAARLVDLRDGSVLWQGSASASSAEQAPANQGGLVGLLIHALVEQVMADRSERSHPIAGIAVQRLLYVGPPRGLLAGPRALHRGAPH